jgi:hypothetical protein
MAGPPQASYAPETLGTDPQPQTLGAQAHGENAQDIWREATSPEDTDKHWPLVGDALDNTKWFVLVQDMETLLGTVWAVTRGQGFGQFGVVRTGCPASLNALLGPCDPRVPHF